MKIVKRSFSFVLLALLVVIAACSSDTSGDENAGGGELTIALDAQPSILDPHITTESVTSMTTRNIFEPLVEENSKGQPEPMLAESIDISDDNKTYTFHLREGVKFHNGEEMTSEDVVASMNRWKVQATGAKVLIGDDEFVEIDEYTVELSLTEPSSLVLTMMATERLAAIMPKDIIESADPEGVAEYIGTGPFQFEEWIQDQYIHLTKHDDYQSVDAEPDGLAGKREALVDDLYFHFVTEDSTRTSGLQTKEYDINAAVSNLNFEQVKSDPNIETFVEPYGSLNLYFNKKQGVFSDVTMRQAVNAALNIDEIMIAAYAEEEIFELDHGYIPQSHADWYSEAGKEAYNQDDAEKAKELLEEAGYDGETITILTTRDHEDYYNAAVVIQEQLNTLDVNVELEVYDWATLLDQREDPDKWDIFLSGAAIKPVPLGLLPLSSDYPGWPKDEKIDELMKEIRTSPDYEDAKASWDELQGYVWEEYLPVIVLGYYSNITAVTDEVDGYRMDSSGPILWNTGRK